MSAPVVWIVTYPGDLLQGGLELMPGAEAKLSFASGTSTYSDQFAVCEHALTYRPQTTAMIPFTDSSSGDGRGDWTVHVPNPLLGQAPGGAYPANGLCHDPNDHSQRPYDGAASQTFHEYTPASDGFELVTFRFSTHHKTTTVCYPYVSRTSTFRETGLTLTSTVAWHGTITTVMGPGVS